MSRLAEKLGRMRVPAAIAGATVAVLVVTIVPGVTLTNASWTMQEWGKGKVGVLDCSAVNTFETRGAGKFLQANVLPIPLASIVDVKGETVTNPATGGATTTPANASPAGSTMITPTTYANPLDVTALSALDANLGGLLQLPLATSTGVYNQYGQAQDNGKSAGAAGAVTNSGAVALTGTTPPATLPGAASLDLSTLLTTALGPLGAGVGSLATAKVGFGAVASTATLDACSAAYLKTLVGNLARTYNIASLGANVNSPLVAGTVTTVSNTLTGLQSTVNGLTAPSGSLLGSVTSLINSLSAITSIASVNESVSLGVTVDTTALTNLLTVTRTDPSGLVSVNFGTGAISVDLAQLFGGINGRNPNTQLLLDQTAINSITTAVTGLLNTWTTDVASAVTALVNGAKVTLLVTLASTIGLGSECVGFTNASVSDLISGTTTLTNPSACNTGVLGLAGGTLAAALNLLTLGGSVGTLVQGALTPLLTTGVITPITNGIVNPLVANLAPIITALLGNTTGGVSGILSLVVNEQNAPQGTAGPVPIDWAGIQSGQYDVAAIGVQVLNALGAGNNIDVDLARSSVGVNCQVGGNATPCAAY